MVFHLLTIPAELAERFLTFAHPIDVLHFSHTSKAAYALVHGTTDHYLWRELWLRFPFDDPRKDKILNIDWKTQLFNRMRAERLLADPAAVLTDNKDILHTLVSIVKDAASITTSLNEFTPSADLEWIEKVISETSDPTPPPALRARLRSYFSLSHDAALPRRRTLSRSYVYDLRNYHPANDWGPFLPDASGRADWVHIEHLIIVIESNLDELPGWRWVPRPPKGLLATRAYSAPGCTEREEDWAGVQGSWRRYISFMDYRDLFDYNFSAPNRPRNPAIFEDPQFHEATRLIDLNLHLTPASSLRHVPLPPRPSSALDGGAQAKCPYTGTHPLLGFCGTAKGINNHLAVIEGVVWMQPGVGVRWRFVSVYDGLAQWSSEGMQIGNVASAFGVVGNWTSSHHDLGDPVGPFWMWKVAGL